MTEIERKENIGDTEIYVVSDVKQTKEKIVEYVNGGLIVVLYDIKLKDYADELSRCFRGGNHMVATTCLASEIPSHTRFILGVGTGKIAMSVRRVATEMGVDCGLVFSAPTTDTILSPNGLRQFKAVFLDKEQLNSCPKHCTASGWGIVLAEPLAKFENYYAEKILDAKGYDCSTTSLSVENDNVNLAYYLLKMSYGRTIDDNATIMARVLLDSAKRQGLPRRLLGEYKFISASVIACLYENYLSSPSLDCALPPAHDKNLDALGQLTGERMDNLLKAFDFFDVDGYFRVGYILSEYRLDLLEKLRSVDFHSAQKKWRRIYADAGYWLKSAFTTKSLLSAMKLSAEIGHGLLRYILESGFAEAC
jgi:hypothetical protein